jgi:hypothetical protein
VLSNLAKDIFLESSTIKLAKNISNSRLRKRSSGDIDVEKYIAGLPVCAESELEFGV